MNYNQAMKHFSNHKKDKFFQQCSFSMKTREKAGTAIAEETASGYYVGKKDTKSPISPIFEDSDYAVDFFRKLPKNEQVNFAIFTDKKIKIME